MDTSSNAEVIEDRSLRDLLLQLSRDVSRLFEQEVQLAKRELDSKLTQLQTNLLALSAGALILQLGAGALTAALILLVAQQLPGWVAAALIGLAFCVAGGLALAKGKRGLQRLELEPKQTIESVKQDVNAIKEAAE